MRPLCLLPVLLLLAPRPAHAQATARQTQLVPYSLMDAATLGEHRVGFAFAAGYPFVQAMVGFNVVEGLDVDVNVDSVYGAATQFGLGPKLRLAGGPALALGASLQGQWTLFRRSALEEDTNGVRHLTGLRNWGVQPALILSTRSPLATIFVVGFYQATFATEPSSEGPLAGAHTGTDMGSNLGLQVGGELNPGTSLLHLFAVVGLDFHLRSSDAGVTPRVELGFSFPD